MFCIHKQKEKQYVNSVQFTLDHALIRLDIAYLTLREFEACTKKMMTPCLQNGQATMIDLNPKFPELN
jgi:hypothetical protein